jgi:FKBP12-rapamycin complex-associated protein
VSPRLLRARDLELAVPGTYVLALRVHCDHAGDRAAHRYRANVPVVRIARFATSMNVISSKQRPRKLLMTGADGIDYAFLVRAIAIGDR